MKMNYIDAKCGNISKHELYTTISAIKVGSSKSGFSRVLLYFNAAPLGS